LTESLHPFPPTPHRDIVAMLDSSFIFPIKVLFAGKVKEETAQQLYVHQGANI
jgi:hypothetical protein